MKGCRLKRVGYLTGCPDNLCETPVFYQKSGYERKGTFKGPHLKRILRLGKTRVHGTTNPKILHVHKPKLVAMETVLVIFV